MLEWSTAPHRRTHPHRHVSQGEQLGRSGYVGVVFVLAAVLISYYSAETGADDALAAQMRLAEERAARRALAKKAKEATAENALGLGPVGAAAVNAGGCWVVVVLLLGYF